MSILETIRKRRSVRTFDAKEITSEDVQKIAAFAEKTENPYNIPIQWKVLDAKEHDLSSPVIVGTETYIAGKMPKALHSEEAFGYAFEKVVLYAQEIGVGTTWIAGTMNRDAFEAAMEVKEGEVMPCVSPLGYPAKKMALRESLMRKGVKADSRLDFSEIFFEGSLDKPLTKETAGKLFDAFEAVRLAPSAVNKQPWRLVFCGDRVHFYEKKSRGYDDGVWDIQKIDIGIALCHFMLAAREGGFNISLTLDEPQIAGKCELEYIATLLLNP